MNMINWPKNNLAADLPAAEKKSISIKEAYETGQLEEGTRFVLLSTPIQRDNRFVGRTFKVDPLVGNDGNIPCFGVTFRAKGEDAECQIEIL